MKEKSHVIGKAKHLQEIARRGFKVPLLFYIDHAAVMEGLKQIPNFETRRKECSLRVDDDELAKLQHQAGQTFLSERIRQELKMLLEKHRNKNWIVRSSFGVEGRFASEIVLSASAYDLSFAVMRVASSLFSKDSWMQILASGKDPNRCELGVIVQEHISGTLSGVALSTNLSEPSVTTTQWVRGASDILTNAEVQRETARFADSPPAELSIFWKTLQRGLQKLETYFQGPVEAEWTFDGVDLWWLKARRVLDEQGAFQTNIQDDAKWRPQKIAETFPDAMTPMGWSILEERLAHSMKSMVEFTGIQYRNLESAPLLYRRYSSIDRKSLTKMIGRSLFYGSKIGLSSLLGFMRLRKTPLSKAQARAALSHRVFLDEASKRVIGVWNDELDGHLQAIRTFEASIGESPEAFVNATQKINELRALCFAFFKTDIAIQFLKEANVHFVSEGLTDELDSTSEMQENARALCVADEQLRSFSGLYIDKSSQVLSGLAKIMFARGRLENEDDIYFVTLTELEDFLRTPSYTLQFLIRRRRESWNRHKARSEDGCEYSHHVGSDAVSERLESGRLFSSQSHSMTGVNLSELRDSGHDRADGSHDKMQICN